MLTALGNINRQAYIKFWGMCVDSKYYLHVGYADERAFIKVI